ncbi:HTH domain-containing protein [Micromonospora sp. M12]
MQRSAGDSRGDDRAGVASAGAAAAATVLDSRRARRRVGVTGRCVRRDVQRLRALGYPVHAMPGVGGGYQLGAGSRLPPLLLDDEEAIATAVSLRLAAGARSPVRARRRCGHSRSSIR